MNILIWYIIMMKSEIGYMLAQYLINLWSEIISINSKELQILRSKLDLTVLGMLLH